MFRSRIPEYRSRHREFRAGRHFDDNNIYSCHQVRILPRNLTLPPLLVCSHCQIAISLIKKLRHRAWPKRCVVKEVAKPEFTWTTRVVKLTIRAGLAESSGGQGYIQRWDRVNATIHPSIHCILAEHQCSDPSFLQALQGLFMSECHNATTIQEYCYSGAALDAPLTIIRSKPLRLFRMLLPRWVIKQWATNAWKRLQKRRKNTRSIRWRESCWEHVTYV